MTQTIEKELKLHIGSTGHGSKSARIPGFLNVDLRVGPDTDIVEDASDLKSVASSSAREIYASHILEHFSHTKTVDVLKEWRRVLKNGGKCYVSVPDFDKMVNLYKSHGMVDFVRNLLYGDQGYDLAYHYTSFTFASLAKACYEAGFSDIKRIQEMPYGLKNCSKLVDTVTGSLIFVHVEATN